jgi:hypothetical protein
MISVDAVKLFINLALPVYDILITKEIKRSMFYMYDIPYMYFLAWLSPIVIPFVIYGIVTIFIPIRINFATLANRLWRTLIVFFIMIAMNYVAVGMETIDNWLGNISTATP